MVRQPRFWLMTALLGLSLGVDAKPFFDFDTYQIDAPFNISQQPISVDLSDHPGKEILLVGDRNGQSRLAMYAFDPNTSEYSLQFDIELSDAYFAYDMSERGDNDDTLEKASLYFLASDHVAKLDVAKQPSFTPIVEVSSIYINNRAQYLKRSNFIKDINNDKLDDVVLIDFTTLNVYLQLPDATFMQQQMAIEPTVEIFENSVSYTETPYYLVDMTFDGLKDLVLPAKGVLDVYPQNTRGSFNAKAINIALNPTISTINWWDARGADGKNLDQSNFIHRTIDDLRDVDNDGVADIIVRFTKSSGVLDKSNDYEVYLGEKQSQNIAYPLNASTAIKSEGTLAQLDFIDVDNDARQEVMASSFDISVSQVIQALLSGSVDQKVLIFSLDDELKYQQRFEDEVELKFSLSSGKSGAPVIQFADLDGDGSKELILSKDDNMLKIYPGRGKGRLLDKKYQSVSVRLPKDGVLLTSDDLNLDGKAELLVRYDSEDNDAKEHRQNRLLVLRVSE
ncbi:VCBS repeat-containing protein [Thalassotalea ponticola]|uniref:FG-GAP repeat domain-containing protein n=1 Tax=Thalassotalea ponticola TaxID=1523392 RepID=UPI0025B5224E|nr:VCBS repeat-containing protein [Thalassotalea ponticola]MDN3653214.1 VCBS repeat-containing protein [Thalassotalea ponticola]